VVRVSEGACSASGFARNTQDRRGASLVTYKVVIDIHTRVFATEGIRRRGAWRNGVVVGILADNRLCLAGLERRRLVVGHANRVKVAAFVAHGD
jgi:hypothetical protein